MPLNVLVVVVIDLLPALIRWFPKKKKVSTQTHIQNQQKNKQKTEKTNPQIGGRAAGTVNTRVKKRKRKCTDNWSTFLWCAGNISINSSPNRTQNKNWKSLNACPVLGAAVLLNVSYVREGWLVYCFRRHSCIHECAKKYATNLSPCAAVRLLPALPARVITRHKKAKPRVGLDAGEGGGKAGNTEQSNNNKLLTAALKYKVPLWCCLSLTM